MRQKSSLHAPLAQRRRRRSRQREPEAPGWGSPTGWQGGHGKHIRCWSSPTRSRTCSTLMASSLARRRVAPPSQMPEELAAVTVPFFLNTVGSLARPSRVVSLLGCSSTLLSREHDFSATRRVLTGMGTTTATVSPHFNLLLAVLHGDGRDLRAKDAGILHTKKNRRGGQASRERGRRGRHARDAKETLRGPFSICAGCSAQTRRSPGGRCCTCWPDSRPSHPSASGGGWRDRR